MQPIHLVKLHEPVDRDAMLPGCADDADAFIKLIKKAEKLSGKQASTITAQVMMDQFFTTRVKTGRTSVKKMKQAHDRLVSYIEGLEAKK